MDVFFLPSSFLGTPGDRYIAIGLAGLNMVAALDSQYTQYNHVVTELQGQTQVYQGDTRLKMQNNITNSVYSVNGLAIHDAIANIRQQFSTVTGKKYAFIAVNKPAEYPELVKRQRELAENEGITIIAIGKLTSSNSYLFQMNVC